MTPRAPSFVPLAFDRLPEREIAERAHSFRACLERRRSVREFASDPVPRELVECLIRSASTAPSGAHRQPWHFAAVSDSGVKRRIREAAEAEERENYEGGRFPEPWLEALAPLGTGWRKPYLDRAPWLVVLFEELHGVNPDGSKRKNYYVKESVGIAAGFFIAAVHQAGLATLPHTPSPMKFLREILGRPSNERAFALFPLGYPAPGCEVPDVRRKHLDEVSSWNPGAEDSPAP